jgi:hypothetical protein
LAAIRDETPLFRRDCISEDGFKILR